MNFYISDLHIGHENVIRFDNRPFANADEMNDTIFSNWNSRVTRDDTVFISVTLYGTRKANGMISYPDLQAIKCLSEVITIRDSTAVMLKICFRI